MARGFRVGKDDDLVQNLEEKVKNLERELADKVSEVEFFRTELEKTNTEVEGVIKAFDQHLWKLNKIYSKLVPTELPEIKGFKFSSKYLPSVSQGGDYLDIFGGENKFRFGLVLSSASGHMMSALILSLLLRFSSLGKDVSETADRVVEKLRKALLDEMEQNDSVDIFYGILDKKNYVLSYSLVGEVPVLHQCGKTGEITWVEPLGPAITPSYTEQIVKSQIVLNSKDRLLICSPGVVRTQGIEGEYFGAERVFDIFKKGQSIKNLHELRNELMFRLEEFSSSPFTQDISVLALEVDHRVIKLA